jgi:hypothetical protein
LAAYPHDHFDYAAEENFVTTLSTAGLLKAGMQ